MGQILKSITPKIALKYALFQLPELLLFAVVLIIAGRWITIPSWFFWGFFVFLAVKDVAVFPFVWRAYDSRDAKRLRQLIGKKGVVVQPLQPRGVVQVNGELWKAEVSADGIQMDKNDHIRVEDIKGFCLIVSRADSQRESGRVNL